MSRITRTTDGRIFVTLPVHPGLLEDGWYLVALTSAQWRTAVETGNDYISLRLEVPDGEHAGHVLRDQATLLDSTVWKIQHVLEALTGRVYEGEMELPDFESFVGMRCRVLTKQEEWRGQTRNVVVAWESLAPTPMPMTTAA